MDNITKMTEIALDRYFTTLHTLGYKSYNDVNKLIVLSTIEELLTSEFSFYITEEDYKSIVNALYCIIGDNCMIDFPSYASWDSLIHETNNDIVYRITEDSILRNTESSSFRIEA